MDLNDVMVMHITWNIVSEAVVLENVVHLATNLNKVEDMIITSQ